MLRLADSQRAVLVQAIPAVANLAIGTLVFGQFLRQQPFSYLPALAGVALWFVFVGIAVMFARGKR